MKYCPDCGAEYLPGHDECPDCLVALVDDPPEELSKPKSRPTLREQRVVAQRIEGAERLERRRADP